MGLLCNLRWARTSSPGGRVGTYFTPPETPAGATLAARRCGGISGRCCGRPQGWDAHSMLCGIVRTSDTCPPHTPSRGEPGKPMPSVRTSLHMDPFPILPLPPPQQCCCTSRHATLTPPPLCQAPGFDQSRCVAAPPRSPHPRSPTGEARTRAAADRTCNVPLARGASPTR